jgi:hypothetical protein
MKGTQRRKKGSRQMLPAARKSVPHPGTATGVESRIFDEAGARVLASAAVSAVVALPHGLPDSLVLGVYLKYLKSGGCTTAHAQRHAE